MMQQTHGPRRSSERSLTAVLDPQVRPACAADRPLLEAFLSRLSPTSAYQRFLTGMAGGPPARLLDALLPEPPAGRAMLAFLGDEVVGHGLWARLRDSSAAEIALVVADRHQRRGIGTALADAVTEDLVAHGVADIEVFSASDNRAVARMVARAAPDAARELDGPMTTWAFPARSRSRAGLGALPRTA
jgi:GNAT superfamily N-acetyltransferase